MPEIANPSWVQVGELGLSFIVIILCAYLVSYTVKTSAVREKQLIDTINIQHENSQKLTEVISELQSVVITYTRNVVESHSATMKRFEEIDTKFDSIERIQVKPVKRTRKAA